MARSKGTVGIVGLGIMGSAFAGHLVAAGWKVLGYDVDKKRCRALAKAGVEILPDAQHLAAAVPTIITSLPHAEALRETVQAVVAARATRRTLVEMSTFALDDKLAAERALAKAGHVMLDCPVSGTGAQARTKDIVVYASGDPKTVKRLRPMLATFSRALHDLGKFGNGSRMKYVANLLVAIHNVASAEALVLGMKAGLDAKTVVDMVRSGVGTSRIFELRAPMMAERRYDDVSMALAVWQKDMKVIGEFAAAIKSPTPLFTATLPIYAAAMASGHGAEDTASVCAVLEAMAALRRPGKKARR
jgi:3-hydroxyisobutyrate dehydrogenase-like beta-hydroxyacid dehydrogenase